MSVVIILLVIIVNNIVNIHFRFRVLPIHLHRLHRYHFRRYNFPPCYNQYQYHVYSQNHFQLLVLPIQIIRQVRKVPFHLYHFRHHLYRHHYHPHYHYRHHYRHHYPHYDQYCQQVRKVPFPTLPHQSSLSGQQAPRRPPHARARGHAHGHDRGHDHAHGHQDGDARLRFPQLLKQTLHEF